MASAIYENGSPGIGREENLPDSQNKNEGQQQGGTPGPNQSAYKDSNSTAEGRPVERSQGQVRSGARGTAAMDPQTRQEVARKGGLAVSSNKEHMAEIGRKGGQSVSRNREHMASIGRKGGSASRSGRG